MYQVHQDATLLPLALQRGEYAFEGEGIPALSGTASRAANGQVHLSLSNLDPNREAELSCDVRGLDVTAVRGRVLTAAVMMAHNTFDQPDVVCPIAFDGATLDDGKLKVCLPPKSVVTLLLS
jgi:alpha-N-arabinofuranosidase